MYIERPSRQIPVHDNYNWGLYWDCDQSVSWFSAPHRCGCGGPSDCPDRSRHIAQAFNRSVQRFMVFDRD